MFDIKSDLEFFCYLKFHLPSDFSIVSEPQTSYYSEWYFNYRVYYKNNLLKEFKGNFKKIDKGYLIREAKQILEEIEIIDVNRK